MRTLLLTLMLITSSVASSAELLVEVFHDGEYSFKRTPDLVDFFKQELPQGDIYLSYVADNLNRHRLHIKNNNGIITYCKSDFFLVRQLQYRSYKHQGTEEGQLYKFKFEKELIGKCTRHMTQNQFKQSFGLLIASLGMGK